MATFNNPVIAWSTM